jgi:signal transduction histidine kinase
MEAESGEQALEIFKREFDAGRRFAGALVDVRMPGRVDGLQFIRKAWQIDPDLLVVVVTAYQDRSVDEIDRMFGPRFQDQWDYLNKPFTAGEIIQKVRQLVSSWNRREREKLYLQRIEGQHQALLAQEQIAATGRFARTIGHDLGNIFQQILSKLETIEQSAGAQNAPPMRPDLEEIMEAVELGGNICQDLLHFSRQYKEEEPPAAVSLDTALQKGLRLLRQEMRKKDIKQEVRVDQNISVMAHEARLVQVFLNLVTNAVYAMNTGGRLSITAEIDLAARKAKVLVQDTGCGISPENMKHIFEPLFTTKGKYGNGLGLTVCKNIIEGYGGSIEVDSKVGEGTTVRLTFMLA